MTTIRRGRQYPDGPLVAPPDWPEGAGELFRRLLNPSPAPGPPYTHAFTGPEPVYARNGKPLYWPPVRPFTLTEG